jgi:hypothetical protein
LINGPQVPALLFKQMFYGHVAPPSPCPNFRRAVDTLSPVRYAILIWLKYRRGGRAG